MKSLRRLLAGVMVLSLLIGLLPGFTGSVLAAAAPVAVYVDKYEDGTLTFHWDALPKTKSIIVRYHTPDQGAQGGTPVNQTTNTAQISGLESDFIYDIRIEVFDAVDGGGNKLGDGLLYYLPKTTFYALRVDQEAELVSGGGYETGTKPRLKMQWIVPKVWYADQNPLNSGWRYANEVLPYMQDSLDSIYKDGKKINTLNYRINISSDIQTLNSGSAQSAVLINQDNPEYQASVAGYNDTSNVHFDSSSGYMDFDLLGRRDSETDLPAAEIYGLPDADIFPGSVYYMNIKPIFKDNSGANVSVVSVGAPQDKNGSMLMGDVPYTYSPLRFQLSKDAADNIYVKVYKLNQGSLDLPRLYYEIQASDDPSIKGDWAVKKTMDDSYFAPGAGSAVTVIAGINPNNEVYYKIVIKSDNPMDRIESLDMPYTLKHDTNKPPVLRGLTVTGRELDVREVTNPQSGTTSIERTTDVTISWEKPIDWNTIKANTNPDNDVYFQILLNTYQVDSDREADLNGDGSQQTYPLKFRLVKYINARSPNIKENGGRLEYKINGFELFSGEESDGNPDEVIPNDDNYPGRLLPNMVYYIQMYSTKGVNNKGSLDPEKMSDKSITISFTTLTGVDREVPLPKNFRLVQPDGNNVDVVTDNSGNIISVSNFIQVQFDKIALDWKNYVIDTNVNKAIYYDLYMSTGTDSDSFIRIGSTEDVNGDIVFAGTDPQSTSVKATIRNFTLQSVVNRFGYKLRPNTTYYFMAKTRLVIQNQNPSRESAFTSIIPVTTVTGGITLPDDASRKPLAPTDFSLAKDESGTPMVSGSQATFEWTNREGDVKYVIICTSSRVGQDDNPSAYSSDPVYQSFLSAFGGELTLDPSGDPLADNFAYNFDSKKCKLKIDKWLFPNRLYYFSIKAVNRSTGSSSVWVSIPVTTMLIDAPLSIEAVTGSEISFNWVDASPDVRAEDFQVTLKGPKDKEFKLLTTLQCVIIKDGNNFYGRIRNLKPDTAYDIRVYKGKNSNEPVLTKTGVVTRENYHKIEVKWMGTTGYKYELAVRSEDSADYVVLADSDLEESIDGNGSILPYYIEKSLQTTGTGLMQYYSVIKTIPVVMPDGTVQHQPLKSNTKYFVKVRAIKTDPVNVLVVSYSKYVGPVDIRTDFNQGDYDQDKQQEQEKASYLEKLQVLERNFFWRVDMDNTAAGTILLKGDRVANIIDNEISGSYVIDIPELAGDFSSFSVYLPVNVLELLSDENMTFIIKAGDSELSIRPGTLDLEAGSGISSLKNNEEVKDIYIRISISHSDKPARSLPAGLRPVSKTGTLELQAIGSQKTYTQLRDQIQDKLYNSETGLVKERLDILLNPYNGNNMGNLEDIEQYINEMAADIEKDLSVYIADAIDSSVVETEDIRAFAGPALVKLSHSDETGIQQPYICSTGTNQWKKVSANTAYSYDNLIFSVDKTGDYVIAVSQPPSNDIAGIPGLKEEMGRFMSLYDLTGIFEAGNSFYPDSSVTVKELVLLYERVATRSSSTNDVRQKARTLGLDDVVSTGNVMRDVTRQETAAVLARLYASKLGVNIENMRAKGSVSVNDEASIGRKYYKYVIAALDTGIMTLRAEADFEPGASISRAELIEAFMKLLKAAGEL